MRNGIHCAGTFLIDHIKVINLYPAQGMLAEIESEYIGTGGGPCNVLINLAKLQVGLPLFATGIIGNDANGEIILKELEKYGIDSSRVYRTNELPTSYTDVVTVRDTGSRTFFHNRGANALLDFHHFENVQSNAKIFHLAYLLLLDKLDIQDQEYKVIAARLLSMLQSKGFKTSVDLVSEDSNRYAEVVTVCLPFIDYLIINEFEAGKTSSVKIRGVNGKVIFDNLVNAANVLFDMGVNDLVVIHFPEGGFVASRNAERYYVPSYRVEKNDIMGTTGAGDSFCAGMLYGIHEQLPLEMCLKIANANARFNLASPTCTGGIVSFTKLKEFMEKEDVKKQSGKNV